MTAASLLRLKITLDHVEPMVMRRVVVPWRIRLSRLHEVLQAAMGWTNTHLYEFQIRDVGFGLPDQEWGDGPRYGRRACPVRVQHRWHGHDNSRRKAGSHPTH